MQHTLSQVNPSETHVIDGYGLNKRREERNNSTAVGGFSKQMVVMVREMVLMKVYFIYEE